MLELTDGQRIADSIEVSDERGNYKFYKFYKGCGDACDMEVRIEPLQLFDNMELMVAVDKGDGKMPTRANKPRWDVIVN